MMNLGEILVETVNRTRIITLNREKALNALNLPMVRLLQPLYNKWISDGDVDTIIMKGSGSKAFCAGGDVVSLVKNPVPGLRANFFREEYILNYTISQLGNRTRPIHHIALIDGITMGGGVGLSVHGSHRIVTENTLFAMPETAIGLFPDVGGSLFLPRLPHKGLGMFLALSGHRLKGADVLHAGVGSHYIPREKIPALVTDLSGGGRSVTDVVDSYKVPPSSLPPFTLSPHLDRIQDIFDSPEDIKMVLTKLDKHSKEDEFMAKVNKSVQKFSPTALCITHEQIKRGGRQSAEENFLMEYRMCQGCMDISGDFNEGIRALLIDKTNDAKWNPATVDEVVSSGLTQKFFQPHPNDLHLPITSPKL